MGGTSRVTGDSQARFCEGLGVKFPGPTRQTRPSRAASRTSAYPPKLTVKADVRVRQLSAISGPAQVQQTQQALLDHLVGAGKQRRRNFKTESLRGRKVYNEIELGRLFDRNFARLRPAQDLVDIVG